MVRVAELDDTGVNRPVGFTHVFNPPSPPLLHATLRLDIRSESPDVRTDYIILDGSGRSSRQPRDAVILLCHALKEVPVRRREPYRVEIDFRHAPVTFGQTANPADCDSEPKVTNLLELLRDGQLDVVISDDSQVDFSELRITHSDPRSQ